MRTITYLEFTCPPVRAPLHPTQGREAENPQFCGSKCASASRVTQVVKDCEICGTRFELPPSRAKLGMARWCSIPCRTAGQTRAMTERFWENVSKTETCWVWIGHRKETNYGVISEGKRKGRPKSAHRYSWEIHNGPIPEGLCVLHRCDNPPCVNPEHLFLGTLADNAQDMLAKGRGRWGPNRGKEPHFLGL